MIKRFLFTVMLFIGASVNIIAQNDVVTNETVLELLKDGFSSEEIIGAIENSSTRTITYDINFMRQLKQAGADVSLTKYLQQIAKKDMGYEGVYLWNPVNGGKPEKVYRTNFEKEGKGFNLGKIGAAALGSYVAGSVFGGHLPKGGEAAAVAAGTAVLMSSGKDIQKLVLPGLKAKVTASTQPVFRFYFNNDNQNQFSPESGNWYEMVMNNIQSPNEFQLIKLDVKTKKKGGKRTFPEKMSYTIMGFEGDNSGKRQMMDFEVKTINNNTFEVIFNEPLEPGEYCFFYKSGLNNKYFQVAPFGFDFSVQ